MLNYLGKNKSKYSAIGYPFCRILAQTEQSSFIIAGILNYVV